MSDYRRVSRRTRVWAWSNCGRVMGVAFTRREAIREVEGHTGRPWKEARKYMEVWRANVTPDTAGVFREWARREDGRVAKRIASTAGVCDMPLGPMVTEG